MKVIPGNAQHIGDRESQQDAFGFSSFGDRAFELHGGVMMVLCDGMGGLANGAAASRAAVDAVLAGYQRKQPSEDIPSALDRVILEAHRAVCAISGDSGAAGTTVVVAVVWQDRLYWDSLGDSRLYLCRGDAPAVQLTEDHNVAALLEQRVRRGESSRREAAAAKDREALTAYLGAPQPPRPDAGRDGLPLQPGDRIVACSDGLYRGLPPEEIAAISRAADPMTAAEQMVQAVLRQKLPHQDNLTVALFELAPHRELIELPGPATRSLVLAGAGGFAAATILTGILISFGVLTVSGTNRQGLAPMAAGQPPPGLETQPATSPAPPPAQAHSDTQAEHGAPATTAPKAPPTLYLHNQQPPAGEKPGEGQNRAPQARKPAPPTTAGPPPPESSANRDAQGAASPKPAPAGSPGTPAQAPSPPKEAEKPRREGPQ